jgi:PAS domain S-box-containing protein
MKGKPQGSKGKAMASIQQKAYIHPEPEENFPFPLESAAPRLHWSEISEPEHFVQFYDTDEFLLDAVSGFIGGGLGAGSSCVVIATREHLQALEEQLETNGLNLAAARGRNTYIGLDAAETLAQFMVDGWPEPELFAEVIGGILEQMAGKSRRMHIFGEMVALLWAEGNHAAAIRLEELWNDLRAHTRPFSLFCAYPMQDFAGEEFSEQFAEICAQHSHTLPNESYSALTRPEDRLRAIALLQQRAASLEAEIMEHKRVEAALRASEERFRTLANKAPLMIWQSDASGSNVYFNTTWCRFTGLSEEESLGFGWISAIHPEDRDTAVDQWAQAIAAHAPYRVQFRLRRLDGVYRYVLVYGNPCFNPEGTFMGYIGTILDITEQKELEIQRQAFISLVTHELKTPLTALQGNVQLAHRWLTRLLSEMEQISAEQREMLEEVLTRLNRGQQQLRVQNRLINDLLDVSHIQEDKLELHLTSCDLVELVSETVQDYRAAHPSRQITLELPEQCSCQVVGDRDRLQQVLSNYLTNALKFSPDAAPVHVRLSRKAGKARVEVQDHGPGLTPSQREHIWDRLYQASKTPVQNGWKPGLGLGLYICHQLIKRQKGEVGVESIPGGGATFWFALPLRRTSSSSGKTEQQEEK